MHSLTQSFRQHKGESLTLLLIVLLAAWLRLGWPGINSFGFDEARVSDMALQMAREGQFAALGMQSSTGIPNFAAAIWFFALPYALSTNPQVATNLVGVLNVLAVIGMWWLGRAIWHKEAGLIGGLLFAVSPYLVFYGRSIWSQNLLAPLAVLWAVAIVAGLKYNKPWLIGLHAFLAGFVGQIHIAGFALAPVSLWLGLRFRLWRHWMAITIGLLLAGLTAVPTISLIWREGAGAKALIRDLLQSEAATPVEPLTALRQLWQLGIGQGWEPFWLNAAWTWPQTLAWGLQAGRWLLAVLVGLGLLATSWHLLKGSPFAKRLLPLPEPKGEQPGWRGFVLLWAMAAPLLFAVFRLQVYPQYQLVSVPALFLLAGAAAAWAGRWWRLVVGTAVAGLAFVQVTAVSQTLTTVADTYVPGGMGTPLRYPQTAVARLTADERPIVVETFGDMPEYYGDAGMFKVLLWNYPHQIVDARHVLLIPNEPAHLLFTYANLPAWEVLMSLAITGTIQELPRRTGELPYMALSVDEVNSQSWRQITPPVLLANGAELHGWQIQDLPERGQIRLVTYWRIGETPEQGHFQQFNHLYLPDAETPHEVQDFPTSSRAWRAGDHLITWAEFLQPDTASFYFHVGMYTWPDLQRSPVLNRPDLDPLYPIQLDFKR